MVTVLQPIVNELNIVLVPLRTELRGLQTDADGAGIAIVMGRRYCISLWFDLHTNRSQEKLVRAHVSISFHRTTDLRLII